MTSLKSTRVPAHGSEYAPLPSVWEGDDGELLEHMLEFHPRSDPQRILDATVNRGRFWRNSQREVVGIDIDSRMNPFIVANNTQMPFANESFDVVVYDPPHIPNQGRDRTKDLNDRFSLVLKSGRSNGYNLLHMYPPFVIEAPFEC